MPSERLDRYAPTVNDLPDRVSYQGRFDLSNEKAAGNEAELRAFRESGRLTGVQYTFSIEAGERTLSLGINYYSNADSPKKLLRESGDPAAVTAPGRFEVQGLGDQYIAQRLRLGSGEAAAHVLNIVFVRGPFFVSIADLGGTPETSADIIVQVARLIDDKIKANPTP